MDETIACCISVCRRFNDQGQPRANVIPEDDDLLVECREQLEEELQHYFNLLGDGFVNAEAFSEAKCKALPFSWWDRNCQTQHAEKLREDKISPYVLLKMCAMKITTLSPSTTPVERIHKVHKSQRTKLRNRLGYARALGLNFIATDHLLAW